MYVAKIQDEYHLKRMPGTGHAHDPSYDSFAVNGGAKTWTCTGSVPVF
jgi:hypothetical protein